jgi:hypothetical protein
LVSTRIHSSIAQLISFIVFQVTSPAKGAQWANNQTFAVSWIKGLLDDIVMVDIEMSRLNTDGVSLIAKQGQQFSSPRYA